MIAESIAAFFLLVGSALIFIAALGAVRFPDLFTRMHAASKATGLGLGSMLAAIAILFPTAGVIAKTLAIILFLFLTTPIAAHMLSRAAYMLKVPLWPGTRFDELEGRYREDRSKLDSAPGNHEQLHNHTKAMDTSPPASYEPVAVQAEAPAGPEPASTTSSLPHGEAVMVDNFPKGPMSVTIRTILVPVEVQDECSFKALTYAVALAKVFGASVTLLHVVEEPPLPKFKTKDDTDRQVRLRGDATRKLLDLFERDVAPEVTGSYLVRDGRSCETTIEVAKEIRADLIVILTHVWTGLAQLINTCSAEKVVRSAPCPVLVVKEKEHEFITPAADSGNI